MYTLHASPGSSAMAAHIVLEELGQPYCIKMMSMGHSETTSAWFRDLNPKGRIPVLLGDDFMLTEAPAILLHLGLSHPSAGLLPSGNEAIVRAVEWTNWLSSAVHAVAVRMIWKAGFFLSDATLHEPLIQRGKEHLIDAFSLIEEKLKHRTFALGSSYSVVDPYLLTFFRWGNRMGVDMSREFPGWASHAVLLEKRDAVQRTLDQEGISLWR